MTSKPCFNHCSSVFLHSNYFFSIHVYISRSDCYDGVPRLWKAKHDRIDSKSVQKGLTGYGAYSWGMSGVYSDGKGWHRKAQRRRRLGKVPRGNWLKNSEDNVHYLDSRSLEYVHRITTMCYQPYLFYQPKIPTNNSLVTDQHELSFLY